MSLALQSTNPVLADEQIASVFGRPTATATTATIEGVIRKTSILVIAAVCAGAVAYSMVTSGAAITVVWLASAVVTLGIFFKLWRNPAVSPPLAFIYSISEGACLGAISKGLEWMLKARGIELAGGALALQAFVVTSGVTLATLGLYYMRWLKPTRLFVSVLSAATVGIGVTYLASFIISLFGISMPIFLSSADHGGTWALVGLGINVVVLIVAALWLVTDFARVEEMVNANAPKSAEWYLSFGLVVTLAWIYWEALKLVFRVAMLANDRK